MKIADAVTSFRLIVSPLFLVLAFLPFWSEQTAAPAIIALWVLFALMEFSDVIDGTVARTLKQVSDMGKLLDPFADVISRLTYFAVFASLGVMPAWMMILIMYREVGIMFVRMVMYRDGIALAARRGGKAKAVMYAVAGGLGILILSNRYLGWLSAYTAVLKTTALVVFGLSVLFAWVSFLDYLIVFSAHRRSLKSSDRG